MKKKWISLLLAVIWPLSGACAYETDHVTVEKLQSSFCHVLEALRMEFNSYYGPREWKKDHLGWTVDGAVDEAKAQIMSMRCTDRRAYQQVIAQFFNSMKDYHVGVYFNNWEYAFLPFDVITVEGRTFVSYVNLDYISEDIFPFTVGDELIEFDGKPVADVLAAVQECIGGSCEATNLGLADKLLTIRLGRLGDVVPQGPISLRFKSKEDGTEHGLQLAWIYREDPWAKNPEVAAEIFGTSKGKPAIPSREELIKQRRKMLERFTKPRLELPFYRSIKKVLAERGDRQDNPFSLGALSSTLPELGEVVWEFSLDDLNMDLSFASTFDEDGDDEDDWDVADPELPFQAYIYENEEGRKIGFIRIPWYDQDEFNAECFACIIQKMEEEAEALVIDQMNNPGGGVYYCYALASMLATDPLVNALDQWALSDCDYIWAVMDRMFLEGIQTDEEAKEMLGNDYLQYPMGLSTVQMYLYYLNQVIDSWERGAVLTKPFHLGMIDHVNPNPRFQFTKPILLLINNMDFSCGDLFPMLMKDNQRAVLMGTRTAGAGGCVVGNRLGEANLTGMLFFTITNSLAWRPNGDPYEDLGITPDIEYVLGIEDIQNNFAPMASRVNEEVAKLLPALPTDDPDGEEVQEEDSFEEVAQSEESSDSTSNE